MTDYRTIGPIGTAARVVIGSLIVVAALALDPPRRGITWWEVVAVLVVLPAIAVGAAAVIDTGYRRRPEGATRTRAPWSAAQAQAAALVIVTVAAVGTALTFLTPMHPIAIYLFFGLSMLLAAVRGYPGCEMLALPNMVLRRSDAIWCPLYTPLDSAEQHAGRASARRW